MQAHRLCLAALLLADAAAAATVAVGVDASQDRRRIDPQIYGVNFGTAAQLQDPGFTVRRWGGNATTRYNWQVDVSNRGFDYVYLNVAEGDGQGLPVASSANAFLSESLAAGAAPLLTLGTIGWTPVNDRAKRYGFRISTYGPQLETGGPFDLDGGNGECDAAINTSGFCPDRPGYPDLIVGNNPLDTSFATGPQWNRDWIAHLQTVHGSAAGGGVRYYALDNEVMLWNSTHRDVHPQPASYDGIWQMTVDHATAIKAQDAAAQVFGPVTWGYCDLFTSAADGCLQGADRSAHEGLPFVRWYLRQVCDYRDDHGLRLVDYLDLHYYPQGEGIVEFGQLPGASENAANSARRLRSLKELYDPAYTSESWMGTLGSSAPDFYAQPRFLRRVREWIDAECPGTRLAITEYQWGHDDGVSSALAQVELLALFGREGVDLATRWIAPRPGTLVERAFRLFLDYDGNGNRVEGDSVRATTAAIDLLGAYAVDLPGQRLMLVLTNKDTGPTTAQISFAAPQSGTWRLYRFDAASDVAEVASGSIDGTALTLANLPARSASLLVIPAATLGSRIFGDGFED